MRKDKTKTVLFGVQSQQLKHLSADEYKALRELCFLSKNMYNVALYNVRQHFFAEKKYFSYESNYKLCKANENYLLMNSNSAQQIMKVVDRSFKSFFGLLKLAKQGSYQYSQIKLPRYLKKDGFFHLVFAGFNVKNGIFNVPMSPQFRKLYGSVFIKVPSNLSDKKIKEVRILPKSDARFFEIQYIYEVESSEEAFDTNNVLAIDLGVDNLATCVTNSGNAFIIDGKRLKSINAYANKTHAKLQSIKDKQKIQRTTKRQVAIWDKRNASVNDYLNKAARMIVNYCVSHNVGVIVLGYNSTIQQNCNIGKANNQNFVNIPIGKLRDKLNYLCQRHNITFIQQEESYTSKADFLSNDDIPVYNSVSTQKYLFSGKRIHRGLYKSGVGVPLNADCNGALNILRKSDIATIELQDNSYLSPERLHVS